MFSVSQDSISRYIKDLKYEYDLSRDALILKLYFLGYSWEENGEINSLSEERVRQVIQNFKDTLKTLKPQYKEGKTIEKIARVYLSSAILKVSDSYSLIVKLSVMPAK